MYSNITQLGKVNFPEFAAERIYMVPFLTGTNLEDKHSRWNNTVEQMTVNVPKGLEAFLMVDQSFVKAGVSHRRPGVHVDMYWHTGSHDSRHRGLSTHGASVPSHRSNTPSIHSPVKPSHGAVVPKHKRVVWGHRDDPPTHFSSASYKESLILASNVLGCVAHVGKWSGDFNQENGDCTHLKLGLDRVEMQANYAYTGDTISMLHESIPVLEDSFRTVVRLNIRGWCA